MDAAQDLSTKYVAVRTDIPLTAAPNPSVTKNAYLQVPSSIVATIQNQTEQSEEEILTRYIKERTPALQQVLAIFSSLMQNNNGQLLQPVAQIMQYDTVLFGLLKATPTSFFYLCDNRLILNWPLKEQKNGWNFSIKVEIHHLPDHPRK